MSTTATLGLPCPMPLRRMLFAAGLALLALQAPAWASPDALTVAATCTPDLKPDSTFGLTSATGGHVMAGRNPPKQTYMCPVWSPGDLTAEAPASWRHLALQYLDSTGGNVNARLYAKNRGTGRVSQIASVTSVPARGINVVSGTLSKPVDFSVNAYYVVFELKANSAAQVHMVMLTN
jgi:hypothetical protein